MQREKPNNFVLRESDLQLIRKAASSIPEVRQLILFGSRAKGTHRPGSDVDLAIKGESASYESAVRLEYLLNEESPLPYYFDVVNYNNISEQRLVEHIDRIGVVLFDKRKE